MRKLSQKELYNEGIGSMLKGAGRLAGKVAKPLGGLVGGVAGAGVGALKGLAQGKGATLGSVMKAAGSGAMTGTKVGYQPLKTAGGAIKDAWRGAAGGHNKGPDPKTKESLDLIGYLETKGYMQDPAGTYGIQGDKTQYTLEVVPFDYDVSTGAKVPLKKLRTAIRTFKATGGSWKEIKPSGDTELPDHTPKNPPVTASYSQKDLLRQLTLLSS